MNALWRQIFFRYWSTPEALAARMAGRSEPLARPRPRMNVVLVKSREEYLQLLAKSVPQIELTVGIYLDQERTAFFYAGDTSVYPTWYHEATHQLFQEAVPGVAKHPGQDRNFWIIEGAALYMESLAERGGYWTAGGCEADRLQLARYRALADDFFMPTTEIVTLSRDEMQTSPDIRKLYSQAAGLAHYLIDGDGGRQREALVDLIAAVYRGEDGAETLSRATGLSYPELDSRYRQFLNVTDEDLAAIADVSRLKNLSLGRTAVTDKGLARLAGATQLEWLDLSLTGITDEGLKNLSGLASLRQLFLEGTRVTDASLPVVGNFKQLQELDLSKLDITDAGLAHLAQLKSLQSLYLAGSPISDTGLVHLRGLKKLELLDTTATKVSPEGLKALQSHLPGLREDSGR